MPTNQQSQAPERTLRTRRLRASAIGLSLSLVIALSSAAYEVRRGDTLASVASEHGTTVSALIEANDIADPDLIRVGQKLVIPGEGGDQVAIHTVAVGETIGGIALLYGSSIGRIAEVNGLHDPNVIRPGQTLVIPDVGRAPSPSAGSSSAHTTSPATTTHVVQPGETLAGIASRYGLAPEVLAAANGITDSNVIYSGTVLTVSSTPVQALTGSGGTSAHVVAAGETLGAIAIRYGTSVTSLAESNGITNPNVIRVGQTLQVPGGGWTCPLVGARYFNDWGFPRSGGRFHQGNDLFAPRGTEVRAPVSGTVELKTGTIGGLQFWMQGDDGNLYIGTHLDAFGKSGRVRAGDVIGYVGDSGNARGASPHVHFEIHVDGSPVNPYPTLEANGC